MTHPHEQLVDLMDGTLDEDLLPGVLAHVETCAECRADLEAARRGHVAARTLPEVDAPADLQRRVQTAAVVVAIAITLPNVGNDEGGVRSAASEAVAGDTAGGGAKEEAPAPESNAAGDAVRVSRQDRDYDQAALQDLAAQEQQRAPVAAAEDTSRPATLSSGTEDAARCVRQAFDGQPRGRLIQMIEARFDGRDAYIAVYLEGPGAGQPADTVAVYAASRDDCQLLSFASALI